jgi:hypothetical protein
MVTVAVEPGLPMVIFTGFDELLMIGRIPLSVIVIGKANVIA